MIELLDTTFSVVRRSVITILTAVTRNVGVPVASAFGWRESVELHSYISEMVADRQYVLESDQGAALKSLGSGHRQHLFSLRHLIKRLWQSRFCGPVANLIRSRARKEFDVLTSLSQTEFQSGVDTRPETRPDLTRCRKKVGIRMADGQLQISVPPRGEAVSMLAKVPTKMASTTKALECFNGYCNAMTPRFHSFWSYLHRLVDMMMDKTAGFSACVRHNYAHEPREVVKRYASVGSSRMQNELTFHQTVLDECTCGETNHLSTIYGVGIPCRHRLALMQEEEWPGFAIRALARSAKVFLSHRRPSSEWQQNGEDMNL
jgi:hypothetical protein